MAFFIVANSRFLRVALSVLTVLVGAGLYSANASASDVNVGGVVLVKPKYEGSDEYEVVGAPFAYPVWNSSGNSALSINGLDDVRFRLLSRSGFEAGVLGGYTFGRDEDDGDLLVGLGDVDGGFIAGAYAGYRVQDTIVGVSYHRIVSGDTGGYFRAGLTTSRQVSAGLKLKLRGGVTYADSDYMDLYFSVPTGLGRPAYDADAGFKDAFLTISANQKLDARWSIMGSVGYKRLIGDAADSPIVASEDQFSAMLGATYRFSLR